jgi:tetratricopeptide (TPR) repeat protein
MTLFRVWALPLILGVLFNPFCLLAEEPSVHPTETTSKDPTLMSLFTEADTAYQARGDLSEVQRAIELYELVLKDHPDHYEALWRLTRAAWWLGYNLEAKKEKIHIYKKGIEAGQKAIELYPDSVEGHFWLGTIKGSYGEAKGVLKSLFLVGPIREEMDHVIRLDKTYEGGGGYRLLGILDYKVPRFAGGSRGRAEQRLIMAYHSDPNNPFNLYYLAEYYHRVKNPEKALNYLEELANATVPKAQQPDLKLMQMMGETLRAKLQN